MTLFSACSFAPCFLNADQTIFSPSSQSNSLGNVNDLARPAAMGSAFTGIADDASALFSNPAGLGFLDQGQLFLNSDLWLVGTFQETALGGIPTVDLGGFGLAVDYLDYGLFEGRDQLGSLAANYSADRLGFRGGWGYEIFQDFSVGIGLAGILNNFAGTGSTAFTSNIGILWKDPRGFGLGASYVNTGLVSPGGANEDSVNLGVSYGVTLDSTNRLLLALGGAVEPSAISYLQAGAEYCISEEVFLRAGCQVPLSDESIGGFTDLTAGVGFHLSEFSVDYAFLPYGDLGAAHRISIGYFFEGANPSSSLRRKTTSGATKPGPKGNAATGFSNPIGKGLSTGSDISNFGQGFTTLPSSNNPALSSGTVTVTTGSAPVTQPRPVSSSDAKDSLVVQFDLPDNPSPSGAELEKEGKYQEALTAYADALKQNPQDTASWWALGNLYRELHQKAYAVQCFEQVLKLEPNNQKLAVWLKQYKAANP